MEMDTSCRTQDSRRDLEISFVVCDVNSEKEQLQVKIFVFEKSVGNLWRCEDRIGFMP